MNIIANSWSQEQYLFSFSKHAKLYVNIFVTDHNTNIEFARRKKFEIKVMDLYPDNHIVKLLGNDNLIAPNERSFFIDYYEDRFYHFRCIDL